MQTTPMQTTTPDDDRPQGGILPLGPTIAILEDEAARHLHIAISRSTIMQTTKHEAINEQMRIAASRPVEKVTDNRTRLERFNDAVERFIDGHLLISMAIAVSSVVSFVVVCFFVCFVMLMLIDPSFIKNEEIAQQKMEQACAAKGGTVEDVVGVKGHTTQGCVVPLA
ncbi:TPA: hypothetical protein QDB01_000318 [Burkholderia vietnamiensis]|nr:hypothetical protein [Burkholderia vietnamiensis]